MSFDAALAQVPEPLRERCRAHWDNYRRERADAAASVGGDLLAQSARVLACSDFVGETVARHPQLLDELEFHRQAQCMKLSLQKRPFHGSQELAAWERADHSARLGWEWRTSPRGRARTHHGRASPPEESVDRGR